MIIFNGSGRMGNQVFEVFFIESNKEKNKLVFSTNLKEVLQYFDGLHGYINTNSKFTEKIFRKFLTNLLKYLGRIHFISTIFENHRTFEFSKSKGFFPICYSSGYFQNDNYFDLSKISKIKPKEIYINKAKTILQPYSSYKKVFIHVRRGDYLKYGFALPNYYYHNLIKNFDKKNTIFIILSDDPEWCKNEFDYLPYKYISTESMIVDYSLIMLCDGGILSNSSFSWCASYMAKNSLPLYAPIYWMGWKEKKWNPTPNIQTSKFTWIQVG